MSREDEKDYLEETYQRFQEADENQREAIIEELNMKGFVDEAEKLEQQVEEDDINLDPDFTSDGRPL